MLNNSQRICIQNSSVLHPLSQSQLPVQTYSFKLQNNKPVKLFIRVKNQQKEKHEFFAKTLQFVQKVSYVFARYKRTVLDQCKDMITSIEEFQSNEPSLLQEMMMSQLPMRNGSFMNTGEVFSAINRDDELCISRPSRCSNNRNSQCILRIIPFILKISNLVQSKQRRMQRIAFDTIKQNNNLDLKKLVSKVIHKISSHSILNLQTSIIRLKRISTVRKNFKKVSQQSQPHKQFLQKSGQNRSEQDQKILQQNLFKEIQNKQMNLKIECFVILFQNFDRLKTFERLQQSWRKIKQKLK